MATQQPDRNLDSLIRRIDRLKGHLGKSMRLAQVGFHERISGPDSFNYEFESLVFFETNDIPHQVCDTDDATPPKDPVGYQFDFSAGPVMSEIQPGGQMAISQPDRMSDSEIAQKIIGGTTRPMTESQIGKAIRQFKLKGRVLTEAEIDAIIRSTF